MTGFVGPEERFEYDRDPGKVLDVFVFSYGRLVPIYVTGLLVVVFVLVAMASAPHSVRTWLLLSAITLLLIVLFLHFVLRLMRLENDVIVVSAAGVKLERSLRRPLFLAWSDVIEVDEDHAGFTVVAPDGRRIRVRAAIESFDRLKAIVRSRGAGTSATRS